MSDLISRADAIEAIASRDETNGTVKVFTGREVNEILSALPSAGQNCVLCEYYTEIETDDGIKGKCTRRTGSDKALPSADRPTGKWADREYCQVNEDAYEMAICSECGAEITICYYDNYCPNCGARMVREDGEKE